VLLAPLHAGAAELPPLDALMSERANWGSDPSEISYVEARCASLHTTVAAYFAGSGTTDFDAQSAKSLQESARQFLLFATVFDGRSKKPMSEKAFGDRIKTFLDFYSSTLQNNKTSLNNALVGVIEKDLVWCNELKSVNTQLSERMKK
jgi:hypothetical protein